MIELICTFLISELQCQEHSLNFILCNLLLITRKINLLLLLLCSAISQLLLARYGSNFKRRVLGTYSTDGKCHHNICPCIICPGDICPYQQYFSCYQPDLDQTLNKGSWEHIQQITTVTTTFVQTAFVLGTFVHISNISAVTDPMLTKL